jgi:hypothetical protein
VRDSLEIARRILGDGNGGTMTSRKRIAVRAVLALLVLSVPSAFASPPRVVTDGTLQIPLADGWFGSVGPGFQRVRGYTHNVAWIVAGNFRFPRDAAQHEGGPVPPRRKLVTAIGDFVLTSSSLRLPLVTRLHLPRHPSKEPLFWIVRRGEKARPAARGETFLWHVRFKGRDLHLDVQFGSKPGRRMIRLANRVLGAVNRTR